MNGMRKRVGRPGWIRVASRGAGLFAVGLFVQAGCQTDGSRCNVGLSHDECADGPSVQCVVPPGCGEAFCCKVDDRGRIDDSNPSCAPCVEAAEGGPALESGASDASDSGAGSSTEGGATPAGSLDGPSGLEATPEASLDEASGDG
jgi:hypothetical protein